MITRGMKAAGDFLERGIPEIDETEQGAVEELIAIKERQMQCAIEYLLSLDHPEEVTLVDFNTGATSSSDYQDSYAELQAWANYMRRQGEEFEDLYYLTEVHSPFLLSIHGMEAAIRDGYRNESDKNVWQIMFAHPDGSHFYWVKYLPSDDGEGWGYRIRASTHFKWFDGERRDRMMQRRYPLDQIVP